MSQSDKEKAPRTPPKGKTQPPIRQQTTAASTVTPSKDDVDNSTKYTATNSLPGSSQTVIASFTTPKVTIKHGCSGKSSGYHRVHPQPLPYEKKQEEHYRLHNAHAKNRCKSNAICTLLLENQKKNSRREKKQK